MSYGRGGATTAQWDLANSDCIVIQGSNFAECHPVGFRFVMEARERGATIIHIDPRFTRTSACADIYSPIRPGTDIAFLGGLINYVLQNEKYFKEYVVQYTNAATLINDEYKDTEELGGVFSGYNEEEHAYFTESWSYQDAAMPRSAHSKKARTSETFAEQAGRSTKTPPRDETLQHPRCVFQILKRHFARYTPELVEQICGTPRDLFRKIAEAVTANSGYDRTTAFCYAVGWTQHTAGVQLIRTCAILQLLLGNIGRPGGGILALRGHAAIQGSTDTPTLYDMLPGYLQMPLETEPTLDNYMEEYSCDSGWWHNFPKYIVSLLKAWYGDVATRDNEYGYQYLPKLHEQTDYSYYPMMFDMVDGKIEGLFVMGENFAVGGPASLLERNALRSLKWCVVRDPVLVETADFWKMDGVDPNRVETEVIYMPAAWAAEKNGSITNTQRLLQWHDKAVDPPGDCRSEMWFMYYLGRCLKDLYAGSTEERDQPLLQLTWEYRRKGKLQEPEALDVLQEMNGWSFTSHKLVSGFNELKDDGSTGCGNWIYSGVTPRDDLNLAAGRQRDSAGEYTNHQHWGYAWPNNRRILYNRCSADVQGKPWSDRKRLIWWDPQAGNGTGQWVGHDVPDFEPHKAPYQNADEHGTGMDALSGTDPFIMHADGKGWIFVPHALRDGPLPAHYEPVESPVPNLIYPKYPHNPVVVLFERSDNPYNGALNPDYPYVITTYRLTEHHTSGAMSRWNTWLSELQPELFAELDPVLAAEKSIQTGDWICVRTARAEVEARAMVTERVRPLVINGHTIHVVGLPYHWGPAGVVTGDIVNDLIGVALDPTVRIHEAKAFTCNLRKGRKQGYQTLRGEVEELRVEIPEGGACGRFQSEGAEMFHRMPPAGS